MGASQSELTGSRRREVRRLVAHLHLWAKHQPDLLAVGLVGSWARNAARMDSDLDVVFLSERVGRYIDDDAWVAEVGGVAVIRAESWGALAARRVAMPEGLEVEFGIAAPSWASITPVDPGTAAVVAGGLVAVHDPRHLLVNLRQAVRHGS